MIAAHRDVDSMSAINDSEEQAKSRRNDDAVPSDLEASDESLVDMSRDPHPHYPRRRKRLAKSDAGTNDKGTGATSKDAGGDGTKDRFIELAQAALEEATMEDERKGVIHEVVEALIEKTGAPLVAEVISEQLRCQELIEKLAEHHDEDQRRRSSCPLPVFAANTLKEPAETVQQNDDDHETTLSAMSQRQWITECMLRLFRILLLSSLVGLVYHFVIAFHPELLRQNH